jgi:hypothetical protein
MMRLPSLIFALLMLLLFSCSAYSQASGLADLKFGRAQIADSQWNVQACTQTATCQIYSKNPGTVYKIPWTSGQLSWATGDYVAFTATGNSTNPFNAVQYSANGTQKAVMGTGHIINMGADYFFFVGNDNNTGQLFSMTQGFANTSGVTWTGTLNPTVAQVNTYAQGGSTTPLAAGQTVAPPAPPPTPAVTNSSGSSITVSDSAGSSAITILQQGSKDAVAIRKTATTNGNQIYIDQVGDNNNITILQTSNNNTVKGVGQTAAAIGGDNNNVIVRQGNPAGRSTGRNLIELNLMGDSNTLNLNQAQTTTGSYNAADSNDHYQMINVSGSRNSVTTEQTTTTNTQVGHFMETIVNGNDNILDLRQSSAGKTMFVNVNGNFNAATVQQKDLGNHYLDLRMTGDGNSATILQEGNVGHKATVDMIRGSGGANMLDMSQSSSTNPLSFSIQQTCNQANCGTVVVRQTQ